MNLSEAIRELEEKRNSYDAALRALKAVANIVNNGKSSAAAKTPIKKRRRARTAEQRATSSEAAKRRWATRRANANNTISPETRTDGPTD